MNIPNKVKVGALTYDVVIVDELDDDDACALVDLQKMKIKIEKAAPLAMEHHFLHEIIHAINSEIEDEQIEYLTMLFHQVIVDNPSIFVTKGGERKHG